MLQFLNLKHFYFKINLIKILFYLKCSSLNTINAINSDKILIKTQVLSIKISVFFFYLVSYTSGRVCQLTLVDKTVLVYIL